MCYTRLFGHSATEAAAGSSIRLRALEKARATASAASAVVSVSLGGLPGEEQCVLLGELACLVYASASPLSGLRQNYSLPSWILFVRRQLQHEALLCLSSRHQAVLPQPCC